jgi:hypothetical protein
VIEPSSRAQLIADAERIVPLQRADETRGAGRRLAVVVGLHAAGDGPRGRHGERHVGGAGKKARRDRRVRARRAGRVLREQRGAGEGALVDHIARFERAEKSRDDGVARARLVVDVDATVTSLAHRDTHDAVIDLLRRHIGARDQIAVPPIERAHAIGGAFEIVERTPRTDERPHGVEQFRRREKRVAGERETFHFEADASCFAGDGRRFGRGRHVQTQIGRRDGRGRLLLLFAQDAARVRQRLGVRFAHVARRRRDERRDEHGEPARRDAVASFAGPEASHAPGPHMRHT